jgi:hypothetical protein
MNAGCLQFLALDLGQLVSVDPALRVVLIRHIHIFWDLIVNIAGADIAITGVVSVEIEQAVWLASTST